ncbi:hypothetical protein Tco_1447053 [Tanacetum coccineum]
MVKKVDDMTIVEYIEYKERMKRQYSRKSGSYFPTYSGYYTSNNNTTIEFPRNAYFNPIPPNTEFNYDYEDMELDEEAGSEEDLDEWLNAKMEKHMSKQNVINEEDALIAIIKSIREECRVVHRNKQIRILEVDLKKSSEAIEDTVNNDSFTNNLPHQPSLDELNPRSFFLPFTIDNYNSYAMTNIDASNNVMPRSIYEYLKLANLGEATMSDDMTQQETLGTRKKCIYDDGSGKDCGMWPTYDPKSSFCYGYKEDYRKGEQGMLRQWVCFHDHERHTGKRSCMGFSELLQVRYENLKIDDTTHERRYYEWVAQNYEFDNNKTPSTTTVSDKHPYKTNHPTPFPVNEWDTRCHITYTGSTSNQNIPNNDLTPFLLEHSELGKKDTISESSKLRSFRPLPCDYSFDEWLKVKIGHTNIYDSDREIVFNEWILDSFDVEEEYAKEIGNSYSRIFDEYKQVFDNEIEHLSNEYTQRIKKRGMFWMMFRRNASTTIEKLSILGMTKDSKKMSYGEVPAARRLQNFQIQFLKEATKFVRDFKSLAKETDESLVKHKALEFEIERLLEQLSVRILCLLCKKIENENVELEFQVLNYAKENAHLKTTYKNLFDSINVTRAQTKTITDSLQQKLHDTIYENAKLRAQLFDNVFEQKDITKGTSVNTKFANQSTERKSSLKSLRNNFVVRQPNPFQSERPKFSKIRVPPKVVETNNLSNPVTSNSVPTTTESKVVTNDKVIAPGMFRINSFKTSREDKFVPINKVRASVRINPITVSQPHVISHENVNPNSNGISST